MLKGVSSVEVRFSVIVSPQKQLETCHRRERIAWQIESPNVPTHRRQRRPTDSTRASGAVHRRTKRRETRGDSPLAHSMWFEVDRPLATENCWAFAREIRYHGHGMGDRCGQVWTDVGRCGQEEPRRPLCTAINCSAAGYCVISSEIMVIQDCGRWRSTTSRHKFCFLVYNPECHIRILSLDFLKRICFELRYNSV